MRNHLAILLCFLAAGAVAGDVAAQPAPTTDPPPTPAPVEPAPTPTPVVAPEVPAQPEVPVEAKPEVKTDKKAGTAGFDKGFFIKSDDGKYSLKITGRVQPFYTMSARGFFQDADKGDADYITKDARHQFEVRRARLTLEGNLHSKKLLYKFQSDYGRGFVTLKDFHGDLQLANDTWLRFGQWKRPFSRQQITSSGRQELTDRAITDRAFGAGRDIGVAIRNNYEKSPDFEWIVGVFNGFTADSSRVPVTTAVDPMTGEVDVAVGTPTNLPVNNKFKPAVVARVGINRGGIKGYQEADLEGGPLRFGVGASVWLEGDYDDNDDSNQKLEVDYILKNHGFSTTGGLYVMSEQDGDSVFDTAKSLIGFHLQAGYMVVPKHWQVAARYALVDDWTTGDTSSRDQQEISVGANYFGYGHDAKLAGALRFIKTGDAGFTDAILFELGANLGW